MWCCIHSDQEINELKSKISHTVALRYNVPPTIHHRYRQLPAMIELFLHIITLNSGSMIYGINTSWNFLKIKIFIWHGISHGIKVHIKHYVAKIFADHNYCFFISALSWSIMCTHTSIYMSWWGKQSTINGLFMGFGYTIQKWHIGDYMLRRYHM